MVGEFFQPVVEFMISENTDIISHFVEKRIFHITAKEIEIKASLHHVAGIDEKHVLLGFPDGIDDCLPRQDACCAVGIGLYVGMCVVGGEDHEVFGNGGNGEGHCHSDD